MLPPMRPPMRPPMEKGTADGGGVLLVDKPAGMTSHDVVAVVRRAAHTRRVGHTGTLDPFATGLLVVLVGRGTRLIPYVDGEPKVYEARIVFGAETDTDDLTGQTVRTAPPPDDAAVAEGVARLTGVIDQIPPAYSAKKIDGTRAYAAAREGVPLDLPACSVTVHEWSLTGRVGASLTARITCSGGTYIRALARDLGRIAGSAAHLGALRRVRSGPFAVDGAVTIAQLREAPVALQPLLVAVPSLPVQALDAAEIGRVSHGNPVAARVDGERVALLDDEQILMAVADRAGNEFRPRLVLRDA
jgi:tRNA pseudouridine55 synthase